MIIKNTFKPVESFEKSKKYINMYNITKQDKKKVTTSKDQSKHFLYLTFPINSFLAIRPDFKNMFVIQFFINQREIFKFLIKVTK